MEQTKKCVTRAEVNIGKLFIKLKGMETRIDFLERENRRLKHVEREHIQLLRNRVRMRAKKTIV